MIDSVTAARQRVTTRDVVIAALFSLVAAGSMISEVLDERIGASVFAVPLFLAVTVPLAWRRIDPVRATAAALGGLLVHIALFGSLIRCGIVFPASFVFAFSVGAQLERHEALVGLSLALGCVLAVCLSDGELGAPLQVFPFFAAVTAAVWGVGRLGHSRGRLADALEASTRRLREARDERARLEVANDRASLSAELDELLQRRLGELARLADGGTPDGDPALAVAKLKDIERESRSTLEEMRSVVGVLRDDENGVPMAPPPTLTHLDALLLRAKGSDAQLSIDGNPRVLPAAIELSAYRIVEHLLAALEDAPGVDVRVRFTDDAVELTVSGRASRRSEAAIERARQRVQLHRGTLNATTRRGRAEAVVSLPVLAAG
jgi:signal transduction histidine kinase